MALRPVGVNKLQSAKVSLTDEEACRITSIAVIGDQFIMADRMNDNVKLFDRDLKFLTSVKLSGRPGSLCVTDRTVCVAVNGLGGYYEPESIVFVECILSPASLTVRMNVTIDCKLIHGISCCNVGIAISVWRKDMTGTLEVRDITGRLLHTIDTGDVWGPLTSIQNSPVVAMAHWWGSKVMFINVETGKLERVEVGSVLVGVTSDDDGCVYCIDKDGSVSVVMAGQKAREIGSVGSRWRGGITRGIVYSGGRLVLQEDYWSDNFSVYKVVHEEPTEKGTNLPAEITKLDGTSVALYQQALAAGAVEDRDVRLMVVGHYGVGKTALRKRLFGQTVDIDSREATDGIEVYTRKCKINLDSGEWSQSDAENKSSAVYGRLAKILEQHNSSRDQSSDNVSGNRMNEPEPAGGRRGHDDTVREKSEPRREGAVGNMPMDVSDEGEADVRDVMLSSRYGRVMEWLHTRCCCQRSSASTEEGIALQTPTSTDEKKVCTTGPEEKTDVLNELKEVITASGTATDDNSALLSIWDFAGQSAFYTTHQVFLSKRAIYLLVTDMSKHKDDIVKDDDCFFDSFGSKSCKVSEFVEFWLNSIHWYCGSSEDPSVPPVILVGTHADKLDQAQKVGVADTYFRCVRSLFMEKSVKANHVVDADFAVDNSTPNDTELNRLKEKILEVASRQPHWNKQVPARWVSFEKSLKALQETKLKIMSRTEIPTLNQALPVPLESDEEMELFLRYQHDLGTILYFSETSLRDYILLDPQWVIDAIKSLITANEFCSKKGNIAAMWKELNTQAILKQDLIKAVWDTKENTKFWENHEHLLKLMERLDLIARPCLPVDDASDTAEEETKFFVPCFLKDKPPSEMVKQQNFRSTCHFCFTTNIRFIPTAVFNRLLAACLTKWPVFTQKQTQKQKPCIYCGCGMFKVQATHRLTVYFTYDVIQIWVTQLDTNDPRLDSKVCSDVRTFVEKSLTRIFEDSETSCALEQYIKCPNADLDSVAEMFKVMECQDNKAVYCADHEETLQSNEMLHGWFEETEETVPGAVGGIPNTANESKILSENFCKLVTFVLDISSQPLRELFIQEAKKLSQPQYTTLDVFLALNQATVLKCCKFQSQKDLTFPPGGKAADISQWDITLLSGLLLSKKPALFPALPQNAQDYIKQIREARNRCQHISDTMQIQTPEFTQQCNELETAVYGIAGYLSDPSRKTNLTDKIEKLKNEPFKTDSDATMKIVQALQNEMREQREEQREEFKQLPKTIREVVREELAQREKDGNQ